MLSLLLLGTQKIPPWLQWLRELTFPKKKGHVWSTTHLQTTPLLSISPRNMLPSHDMISPIARQQRTSPQLGISIPSANTEVATTMDTAPSWRHAAPCARWFPVAVLPRDTGITVIWDKQNPCTKFRSLISPVLVVRESKLRQGLLLRSGSLTNLPAALEVAVVCWDHPQMARRSSRTVPPRSIGPILKQWFVWGRLNMIRGKSYQPNSHCSNPNSHELNHVKPMCLLVESPQIAI